MTTKQEYEKMFRDETGHDFQRSPLEPTEAPVREMVEFGLGCLGALLVLLLILKDVLR